VGGAAVELYTAGQTMTGDFDIVTAAQAEFEEALRSVGFVKPTGSGMSMRGWIHPDLAMGVEVVGSTMMGGAADPSRRHTFATDEGMVTVIGVEDLIADRIGQYAASRSGHGDMLDQAKLLYASAEKVDLDYLDARIRQESGGDFGRSILG
jgi:hypothetical protein